MEHARHWNEHQPPGTQLRLADVAEEDDDHEQHEGIVGEMLATSQYITTLRAGKMLDHAHLHPLPAYLSLELLGQHFRNIRLKQPSWTHSIGTNVNEANESHAGRRTKQRSQRRTRLILTPHKLRNTTAWSSVNVLPQKGPPCDCGRFLPVEDLTRSWHFAPYHPRFPPRTDCVSSTPTESNHTANAAMFGQCRTAARRCWRSSVACLPAAQWR